MKVLEMLQAAQKSHERNTLEELQKLKEFKLQQVQRGIHVPALRVFAYT
jgi:hypothetical protein